VKEEREELMAKLEQALREAEQANRNKDEFLALLGHELRNPLAPITNAVHLMQLKGDSSTAGERASSGAS
jgi:signal transduction histidine kinase